MSHPVQAISELFGLSDKTVVVTGASSGMGKAIARLLATAGAKVVMSATTPAKLEAAAEEIRLATGTSNLATVAADVSDEVSVLNLFEQAKATFGSVDVLVNCAGIYPTAPFLESTVELWDRVHAINSRGAYLCSREAIRQMKITGNGGSLVLVSSVCGQKTTVHGHAQYGSSKAGVDMLAKTLALEFGPEKIRVNAVLPGLIDTEGLRSAQAGYARDQVTLEGPSMMPGRLPLQRIGNPDDVAAAVLFLASNASCYVTGQLLAVDGGFMLS